MSSNRLAVINAILTDLMSLKQSGSFQNLYALERNIDFFNAIKSFPSYLKWILTCAPYLEKEKLLELQDLPFTRWDREMHARLIEMERRRFPGLIKPLVDRIVRFIIDEHRTVVIANFGYGGMEVERQILQDLLRRKHTSPVLFIGIDKSSDVPEIAKDNLKELGIAVNIDEIEKLTSDFLEKTKSEISKHTILLCKNDIFSLTQLFSAKSFDLIFHSLFMHHLSPEEKRNVRSAARILAKNVLEYDGYKNWPVMIPQTIVGWNYPPFFNAEIFSNLRFDPKKEVQEHAGGDKISFFRNTGTYLREYKK